jgi:hypothetical protein
MKEPFFKGVNWDDVLEKKLKPPYVPEILKNCRCNVTGKIDPMALVTHNFDLKHVIVDVEMSLASHNNKRVPKGCSDNIDKNDIRFSDFSNERETILQFN